MADEAADTQPEASPTPLEGLPSPFLLTVARAFMLAPNNSTAELALHEIMLKECERQGVDQYELLSLDDVANLNPEDE